MKRKIISVLLAVMMLFSVIQMSFAASAQNGLSIPDGAVITKAPSEELQINFWLADGVPYYSVLYRGTELIEPSAMGLSLSTGELSSGFTVENVSSSTANDSWSPVAGEKDVIIDSYNQNAVKISQESGQTLTVEMRAYDTGVAFRYILPEGSYTVNSEYTQYKIPGGTSADVHVGGNQTVPRSVNVENFSGTYRSPMTLEYPQGYVVTLCEANIDNYAPLRLQTVEPRVLRAVYGNGGDTVTVENSDPAATPWRTFVVGATLERLPENSDIILNLNEAPEGDFSWVKPGKNIMTSGNNTTESMKEWIDCAKEQNYDYVLIDTGWYGPEWDDRCDPRLDPEALNDGSELSELLKKYIVGDGHFKHPGFPMYGKLEEEGTMVVDLNMPEVCEYAKSQGIGIILYVEDRALFDTRGRYTVDELLSRFASWGASGIKPGFVQYQTQEHQKRLEEMIATAAKYKLIMTIHDEYVPTGIERTYPNCLTTEGILGDEGINGEQIAEDIAVLFTRLIQGPSDHTFCYPGKGTKAYALASPILFKTGLQSLFWYGNPAGVASCNQDEIKLWRDLPGEWDELNVLEASTFEYATYARRNGDEWFVGSLSAIDRELTISLDFLEEGVKYVAEIYADPLGIDGRLSGGISSVSGTDKANEVMELDRFIVDSESILSWAMKYGTGYAVRLYPASEEEQESIDVYSTFPLDKRIEYVEKIDSTIYTPSTWEKLEEAVDGAREVAAKGDEASPEEVVRELAAINEALAGLRSVEALVNAIARTSNLCENHYTSDTWRKLAEAVENGNAVISSENASQEQIDEAVALINTALDELVKKDLEVDTVTYLSDLGYEPNSTTAWGSIGIDRSYENTQIQLVVDGEVRTFEKGVGAHATSNIYYNIEGKGYEIFESYVGVDAIKPIQGNIVFRVYGDGKLLYETDPSGTGSSEAQFISVPVANVKMLRLEANMYDSDNGDHADWADAKLLTMKEMDQSQNITGISINGVELPEFSPGVFYYRYPASGDGEIPDIDVAVPNDGVKYDVELPGRTPGTVKINVERPDGTELVYTIDIMNYTTQYLSDLTPDQTDKLGSSNGGWLKDISYESNPMAVTGAGGEAMIFDKGVGMHASFRATYNISGKNYGRFTSWVGASHFKEYANDMTFRVYFDDSTMPVFDSGSMKYLDPALFVDLDLSGVDSITLELDMNDADYGDHGNWADAKFLTYTEIPDVEIVSVENPDDISVTYGTDASKLRLPGSLNVALEDGRVEEMDVTWNLDLYDPDNAGVCTIEGEIDTPEGVANSAGIKAVVKVTVREKLPLGISSIKIGGAPLYEFDEEIYEYTYPVLDIEDGIPEVTAEKAGENVTVEIKQAAKPGDMAVVNVTREDGSVAEYHVSFELAVKTYLSDLEWASKDSMSTLYGDAVKDSGVEGLGMSVTAPDGSEMKFEKGIGMQSDCTVTYDIEGMGYSRLEGYLGASHLKEYNNNMIFKIYADNEISPRYTSGVMKYGVPAEYVNIDISGVKTLKLVLDKNGVDSGDHGNWADIKFISYQDLSEFIAKTEGEAIKGIPFDVVITTPPDVENITLKNEAGRKIGIVSASREINQHGGYTWNITTQIGTAGEGRIVSVYGGNEELGTFSIDIVDVPSGIYDLTAPETATSGEWFEISARTTRDLIKGKVVSETGKTVANELVSRTVDGDYIESVYRVRAVTEGDRQFTFKAAEDMSNDFAYGRSFEIRITEKDINTPYVISILAPRAAVAGEKFAVEVISSKETKYIDFINESGGKLGKTLVSRDINDDGTATLVYEIAIQSVGSRNIEVVPTGAGSEAGKAFLIEIV